MGLPKLILRTVNKYLKGRPLKTIPKFGNGNGNVQETKDQLYLNDPIFL
jgi:hypothetical protein